ncbi:MAG: signal peptidase I [Candidatus Cloacimonetes bacterium]|nr:signal peptidase I [Candidatus Cloacimonadota bacterium]
MYEESIASLFSGGLIIIWLVIVVFMLFVMWRVFEKAGKPGWAAIIPIYNTLVLLDIAGKPWWWIFVFLLGAIPIVGYILVLVVMILIYYSFAANFGKGVGFTVGLVLLPIVFFPILAFGDAQYIGNN